MFGFSFTKLLFTAAAIFAVWYGFKWVSRLQEVQTEKRRPVRRGAQSRAPGGSNRDSGIDAEDMVACPACGDFVVAKGARNCGRADCPYPG